MPQISLSQRGGEPSAATGLSPEEDSGGNAHVKEFKKYHLQLPQVCNVRVTVYYVYVCMCEHVSVCVCIVYISACIQF